MMQTTASRLPAALTLEKPASNLASLAIGDGLARLSSELVMQWEHLELFRPLRTHGIRPLDRALFFGPPGNGKTMSAQVVAARLKCPLYRVCCDSLLDSAFGQTQKNLIEIMDWLAAQPKCVVLWDECETIFPSRQQSSSDACSAAITNTMQLFWQRLDRWETPQLFLLATNMIDRVDSALLSRCELQIEFGPPTLAQALQVLEYWEEVFHAYHPHIWGGVLRKAFESGQLPSSFRALWQSISSSVRSVVISQADK